MGTTSGSDGDSSEILREDYKLKVNYRTEHFGRMWTRFNFMLSIQLALFGFLGYLLLKSDAEEEPVKIKEEDSPHKLAGWVVGPYLVVHIVLLSILALLTWIAPDWANFVRMVPLLPSGLESIGQYIQDDKFHTFQNVVLAACAAGLGGAVFMVREFYLNFAYGRTSARQPVSYLKKKEIPRYILLPFSSVVLGPIALSLLLAGSIVFVGFSADEGVPHFSAVAASFLLGFTYHDTLKALRKLSRRLFDRKPDDGKSEQSAA